MRPNRQERALTAWVLYFSILFGALACAIGHGQLAAQQLSGLGDAWCSVHADSAGSAGSAATPGSDSALPSGGSSCALSSSFSASILAAFFGLLGLLAVARAPALPRLQPRTSRRLRWPTVNPRASPAPLPAH